MDIFGLPVLPLYNYLDVWLGKIGCGTEYDCAYLATHNAMPALPGVGIQEIIGWQFRFRSSVTDIIEEEE